MGGREPIRLCTSRVTCHECDSGAVGVGGGLCRDHLRVESSARTAIRRRCEAMKDVWRCKKRITPTLQLVMGMKRTGALDMSTPIRENKRSGHHFTLPCPSARPLRLTPTQVNIPRAHMLPLAIDLTTSARFKRAANVLSLAVNSSTSATLRRAELSCAADCPAAIFPD